MESESVEVTDLYLAAYYVIRGCAIERVKSIPAGSSLACSILIRGEVNVLRSVQEEFFSAKAEVNLLSFRHAYNQVNNMVHQAKRNVGTLPGKEGRP